MRLPISALFLLLGSFPAVSQQTATLLESVAIEGSAIPQSVILEMAGLRLAAPIDKTGIDQACEKLAGSGIFASVSYRFASGPKRGYAVTLVLADQAPLAAANIDVPGVDEAEAWRWLSTRFHRFDRQVPQVDAAQKFLAAELERHLGPLLRGQHLTVRMELDLKTRKVSHSFQPERLPRLQSVAFTGNRAVPSSALASVLNKVVVNSDYTDRKFAMAVELNLRPLYEDHGFYRVRFTPAAPQWSDAGPSLVLDIVEGLSYQLGKVDIEGDSLPVDSMLSAAELPYGKIASWKQIQNGLYAMEKVVKRTGYMDAAATADRDFDDAAHVLNLRIRVRQGPLYRFGQLRITGLSPDLEAHATRIWKLKPGDPYDYAYPNEFARELAAKVNLGKTKFRTQPQKGAGDHIMDVNLTFTPR